MHKSPSHENGKASESKDGKEGEDYIQQPPGPAQGSPSEEQADSPTQEPGGLRKRCLRGFDHFAAHVTKWTGSPFVFGLALGSVIVWAITGPIFGYSETWQLVINTGTTIITFLMVFLIQQSQNKDSEAVHIKLNELLKSHKEARNTMIDIEHLDEEDLKKLAEQFRLALGRER